jgi:hypothetical protein
MTVVTHSRSVENKISFHVRRVNGITEGAAPQLDMVVYGRSITQLRTNIASAMSICFGQERGFQMLVGRPFDHLVGRPFDHQNTDFTSIRPGDDIVMIVDPPPQYAGNRGAHAVVVSASPDVYIQFEGRLFETYPRRLFLTFFIRVPRAKA